MRSPKFAGYSLEQPRRYSTQSLDMPSTGLSTDRIKHSRAMSEDQQIKDPRDDDENQTENETMEKQGSMWCPHHFVNVFSYESVGVV